AFDIRLRPFEFGDEHDERRESTLIVDSIEEAATATDESGQSKRQRITPKLGVFMTSVQIALDRDGKREALPNKGPKRKTVRIEAVGPIYYDKGADLESESKRKAFARQLNDAIERELIVVGTINGEAMLWLPTKD